MAFIILITIYLVSVFAWKRYIEIAYSKGGIYEDYGGDSLGFATFIMICPLLNTILSIVGFLFVYPKAGISYRRFYNIKK